MNPNTKSMYLMSRNSSQVAGVIVDNISSTCEAAEKLEVGGAKVGSPGHVVVSV